MTALLPAPLLTPPPPTAKSTPWLELLERSPLCVSVHDRHSRVVSVNAAYARLLGYSVAEARGLTADDITHPADRAQRSQVAAKLFAGELDEAVGDGRMLHRDGHPMWVRVFASAVTVGQERLIMVCVSDVGGWQSRVDELHHAATHDELTGALNRTGLFASVAELMSRGRAARLALLDLNGLKTINDFYGHAAGDQAIRVTAECLLAAGAGEWLVGRLGGDEFAIVCPDADVDLVAKIAAALAGPITVAPGVSFPVSASIGQTMLLPGDEFAAALHDADERMYVHKRGGLPRPQMLPHQATAGRTRLRQQESAQAVWA